MWDSETPALSAPREYEYEIGAHHSACLTLRHLQGRTEKFVTISHQIPEDSEVTRYSFIYFPF